MWLSKKRSKDLFIILLKTFLFIMGLNIFLTSIFTSIKIESKKNNLESEMNKNIKRLKYNQITQFYLDIY